MTVNLEQVDKQIAFGVAKQYREANRTRLQAVMQEIDAPLDISRHIESEMTGGRNRHPLRQSHRIHA